ncbi:putative nucleic acid-binding protein, contains PIN domain [Candidatus Fervidibacteria bacterium JGI MDM2 JNZ-1-D12]
MERTGFSDTGFFYAVADLRDRWHEECVTVFETLKRQRWKLITTLLVVAETHALILQRMGQAYALNVVRAILESVEIIPIEPSDIAKALEILERYADKDFSLTDAISFAVMERLGVKVALAVDRHFIEYGADFFVAPLMGTEVPQQ